MLLAPLLITWPLIAPIAQGEPVLFESQWEDPVPGGTFICWGWDVDAAGDVAVSCAPFLPALGIFERNGSSWTQVLGNAFTGINVATDGTTVLSQVDFGLTNHRRIAVYEKQGGNWVPQQTLIVGANSYSFWVKGLDVFEDSIVVTGTDAAELWQRQGGTWARTTSLVGSDTQAGDEFAWSVSVFDRVVVVGAPETNGGGAAYVFLELGGQWSELQKLTPPGGQLGWQFGYDVDVHAGRIAIGVPGYDVGGANGGVFTYRQIGNSFQPTGTLPNFQSGSSVGSTLDLSDDWLIAGHKDPGGTAAAPRAQLYHRVGESWESTALLNNTQVNNSAGGGVAVTDDWAIVGSDIYGFFWGLVGFYPLEDPPISLCTSKLNTDGCLATIDGAGLPSFTQTVPFDITVAQAVGAKPGLMIYGYASAALPFVGGTLCIQPPLRRTPPSIGTGDATPCSGTYAFDFDAQIKGQTDPLLTVGAVVTAQYWYRDPGDAFGAGLTNALEFAVWP